MNGDAVDRSRSGGHSSESESGPGMRSSQYTDSEKTRKGWWELATLAVCTGQLEALQGRPGPLPWAVLDRDRQQDAVLDGGLAWCPTVRVLRVLSMWHRFTALHFAAWWNACDSLAGVAGRLNEN